MINLLPVVGVVSSDQLVRLYGVPMDSPDLALLMRHRAVLFGLLGSLLIYSMAKPSARGLACTAGLVSMLAFVLLAWMTPDFGPALQKIVIADLAGSVLLLAALIGERRRKHLLRPGY